MYATRTAALFLALTITAGCEATLSNDDPLLRAFADGGVPACPQDPDCAISGQGCNVCPAFFICQDQPEGGKRCVGPRPDFPDDGGGKQCSDVLDGAATECSRAGTVPDDGGGAGWSCVQQGDLVVCSDDRPNFPDDGGASAWDCRYEDEFRVCENDGDVCESVEQCDNGSDDDCDGAADCGDADCAGDATCVACVEQSVVCENGLGCNGHLGDNYEECVAAGNEGGCSPVEFDAWCRRRLDDGAAREAVIHQWVDDRCNGDVVYDESNGTYSCRDAATCTTYECTTPLVLLFDEAASVECTEDDGLSSFDLSARQDGSATRTDWPSAATPWLALDRDGDGRISSGRELFGSASQLGARTARHGFQALAALDADRDGDVDGDDPGFAHLLVWSDADGDRVSQPSELRAASDLGVVSFRHDYQIARRCDARGNCEVERAGFAWRDRMGLHHHGAIVDVHLAVRNGGPVASAAPPGAR